MEEWIAALSLVASVLTVISSALPLYIIVYKKWQKRKKLKENNSEKLKEEIHREAPTNRQIN
jgi:hypothetical protein